MNSASSAGLFQFPPPRGGEQRVLLSSWAGVVFQFPPPRGGEPVRKSGESGPQRYFNSRPREGANLALSTVPIIADYFNSRPREGANAELVPCSPKEFLFQFPPPRGGEPRENVWKPTPTYFNSRPREGANILKEALYSLIKYFNSRPREGANSKTAQNRAVYLVSLLKFGRISAILPYILSATRAKKRETPKIIGFLLRRPTGRSCMEQVGAGGVR